MLNSVVNFADKYGMFPESGLILAAVSGGADSMCLLEVLREISVSRGFTVAAVHFNHMLRGAESDRDAVFVADFCREHDIKCYSGSGDVRGFAGKNGLGMEEAAREMRYAFFYEAAGKSGAVRIATAHTADDNAETVLMNLTRGTGLNGLCGIPPVRGAVIRPLLAVSRDNIIKYLSERAIPHVEDSSNSQDIYTRNIIRHSVIPVLKGLNPRLTDSIASSSELLRTDEDYLSALAGEFIAGHCRSGRVDAALLASLPAAVTARVIRRLAGTDLSRKHIHAVLGLCLSDNPSAKLSLPALSVRREYGDIVFGAEEATGFCPAELLPGKEIVIPAAGLKITNKHTVFHNKINNSFTTYLFKCDNVCGKIMVRSRKEGDKIDIAGRNGSKKLKKLFIDMKIPREKRSLVPVLADGLGVIAVYGAGTDKRVSPSVGDAVIEVQFEETI